MTMYEYYKDQYKRTSYPLMDEHQFDALIAEIRAEMPKKEANQELKEKIKPEKKSRRMTYVELAEWLAKGNGICVVTDEDIDYPVAYTHLVFALDEANDELPDCYKIRGWHEKKLHDPLIEE